MATPRRSGSTDPRAVRVREAVKAAALNLVAQRPVSEISVAIILDAAEVSRQAFYEHFRDRDAAILTAVADDLASSLNLDAETGSQMPEILHRLTALVDSRRQVYLHMRGSPIFDAAVDNWRELLLPACQDLVAEAPGASDDAGDGLAVFVLGGLLESIRRWLRSEEPVTPTDEADRIWRQISRLHGPR